MRDKNRPTTPNLLEYLRPEPWNLLANDLDDLNKLIIESPELKPLVKEAVRSRFDELNSDVAKSTGIGVLFGVIHVALIISIAVLAAVLWPILIGVAILGIYAGSAALNARFTQEPERQKLRKIKEVTERIDLGKIDFEESPDRPSPSL
jgi:hypothetical protein